MLNLGQGDQKAADYLKINPTARIPTLIDPDGPGGKPLTVTQSWAILMYLCEKTGKFLPADPVGAGAHVPVDGRGCGGLRADQPEHLLPRRPHAGKGAGIGDQVLRGPLRQSMAFCRRAVGQTPYLAGNEVTAADLAVYPIYAGRKALPDNAGLKHLQAWGDKIGARPGVQKGMRLEV